MPKPSIRRSKRIADASNEANSTNQHTTANPTSITAQPTTAVPTSSTAAHRTADSSNSTIDLSATNQQPEPPQKKKGPRKKASTLKPRKKRAPRSKRNPPDFVGTKGRPASSGNGVHPGIPKSRSAKSKQAIVPATAQPTTSNKERSRALLLATTLLQGGQASKLLNLEQDQGTHNQVYLECIADDSSGNSFGFKIRTEDRIHYEFDLNGKRSYRLYYYKHDLMIILDILYRRQLKTHLELYLDATTHQKVREVKNVIAHIQGFMQKTSGYKKDKSSKLQHSNFIPQAKRIVPMSTASRYQLRPTTARQERVAAAAAATVEENPVWRVHLSHADITWEFSGWLGQQAKDIEALEGGWITGDGEIIGLDCDWEHDEDEWRVQGSTEVQQANPNVGQSMTESTLEDEDEAVPDQVTTKKSQGGKQGGTSKGKGKGKKKA